MANMIINQKELSALSGLPYLQQLVYLRGLRPYVDYQTGIVGIKRGISYQSLAEELYIDPHPGIKGGSPHKEQIRRALRGLERANLIAIQSYEWKLIVYCLLVVADVSVQNKPDNKPTNQTNANPSVYQPLLVKDGDECNKKDNRLDTAKPDIPLKSVNNNMCVSAHFERFWSLYPKKIAKQKAMEIFQELQPSDELLVRMFNVLQEQIDLDNTLKNQGIWAPKWKFPANWLAQHAWEDEIDKNILKEHQHAKNGTSTKQSPDDFFWESCKAGAWIDGER